jgi:hypothetical protein
MGLQARVAAVLLLALAGCTERALPLAPEDLGARLDLALPARDLAATACGLTRVNAYLPYRDGTFAYSWFGNQGGLQDCSTLGSVMVLLGTKRSLPAPDVPMEPIAKLAIATPLQMGTQNVDVMMHLGSDSTLPAILELTAFTVDPEDHMVTSIAGRLTGAEGNWGGSFDALRCPELEWVCLK